MNKPKALLVLAAMLVLASLANAQTFYVDKENTGCLDSKPGTETEPWCTLAKAAATAQAGDTVLIKAGEYNEVLKPANSGVAGSPITFKSYGEGETAIKDISSYDERVLTHPSDPNPYYGPIWLEDNEYIVIDGINLTGGTNGYIRSVHSNNNTIKNCHFKDSTRGGKIGGAYFFESHNNRIENCTIEGASDNMALIYSNGNVVQNNTFGKARHVLLTIKCGSNNVVRNNYFYNEIQKIMEIFDCEQRTMFYHGNIPYNQDNPILDSTKYNLVEGNEFAYTPSSGDNSPYSGIQYAGQKGIIRKNLFYETVGPGLSLTYYPTEAMYNYGNRIYNNVFYKTDFAGISISGTTSSNFHDQVIKSNILAKSIFVANDTRWSWYTEELAGKPVQVMTGRTDDFVFEKNNLFNQTSGESYLITYGTRSSSSNPPQQNVEWWQSNYPEVFKNNLELDPLFANPQEHDFRLVQGSQMIDAGAFLTTTTGPGNSSTTMQVADAGYFFDGFGIPGETGDVIQLEGQMQTATITSINYTNNTLTLSNPLTWTTGQGISLAYSGNAPDIGAFEYEAAYYVSGSQGCSDSGPGTETEPWCTIGKASQTLQAGETVLIREGTYNEENLQPANNGQPGQFITFAGYPGENVHIKGSWNDSGDTGNCFRMNNASYIRITGVEISNYKRCIYLESANDNIVVDNVQVHDCIMGYSARGDSSNLTVKDSDFYRISDPVGSHDDGHAGVELVGGSNIEITNVRSFDNDDGLGPSGDADGFSSKWVDNLTFTNCTANDNSEDGFDLAGSNVKLINCKAYNVGVNGLKSWRRSRDDVLLPSDFTVINFITSGNGENGISASNGPDISIYNSVIYNNGAEGIRFLDATSGDQPEAILYNNILMGNGFYSPVDDTSGYIAFYVGSNWNVASNYNIYYNNDRENQAYSGEGPNSLLNSNPEFVSPEQKNFKLLPTSPAIDRGTSVSAIFDYDFEVTYRPQGSGWDIGAYELEGSTPDPECTGTDTSCGTWPGCQNCNSQDGCSGDSYRDYRCSGTSCTYTTDNCTDCSCSCGGYNTTESIANNNCADGKDNDCDSLTDAADTGCEQPPTCGNGQIDPEENCENCPQDIQCPSEEICCAAACITPECTQDTDCLTEQHCTNQGTCNAACTDCNITCSTDTECDDQDPETIDTCINQGTCESFCRNEPVTCGGQTCSTGQICCNQTCTTPECNSTTECNDQDQCTRDYCSQAGTCNAQCTHTEIQKCGWKNMTWVLPSCFPIDRPFQVTVTDETGSPLQGVTIEYGTQTETTDASGKTELTGEKAKYLINATKDSYYPLSGKKIATATCNPTYTTGNGKPTIIGKEKINIQILDTPYIGKQFTLKITDKDGNPIEGATVEYSKQTVTTDQTGQAELQGEKAKYLITATATQGKETKKILPKTYVEETTDQNTSGSGTEQPFALPLDIIAFIAIIIVGGIILLRARNLKARK